MPGHRFHFGYFGSFLLIFLILPYFLIKMLDVSNFFVTSDKAESPGKPPMELNEKQRLLIGKWKHESAENSDPFLKKIGIGMFLRQVAKIQKPMFRLTYDGESWHLYIESAFKNHDYPFKIGEKYLQTTIDGRRFWCLTTLDENGVQMDVQKVTEDEPHNIPSVAKRWVEGDTLIIQEECDGVISKRTFSRIKDE